MRVTFTYATLDMLPAIVETYNATIPSRLVTADLEPVTAMDRLQWFNAHTKEKRPLWLVHKNGVYAGWMSFNSFYGRPAYNATVEVSIYLEKTFQGQGLGKACLQYAQEVAPSLHISTILGFIFGHNTPSLELFYKFGYEKWAHLPRVANLEGVERDLLILGKRVG